MADIPDISKITLPSGTTYNIKDATARTSIANINTAISGGMHFIGVTTTALIDQATTSSVSIGGSTVTPNNGDVVVYNSKEFVWEGATGKWLELGDLTNLGTFAYVSSVSYTPTGSVTGSFSGTQATIKTTVKPEGSVTISTSTTGTTNYTPTGTITAPTITVTPSTTTVNSITAVGTLPTCTLPTLSATVSNEILTLSWTAGSFSQGTLPTKGSNTTVVTGIQSAGYNTNSTNTTAFTFSGTAVAITGSFTGTSKAYTSNNYTPAGSLTNLQFTGNAATITPSS